MALSPLRSKAFHHGRSLSYSWGSHPAISKLDEKLSKVRAFEETSTSLSLESDRLNSLRNLHINVDDLLSLPHIHQIISQESQEKWFDQILEGYIRLLDAGTSAKDLVSHTKHDIQELLSALRRKDINAIHGYLASRKKSKKMIQKSLKNLKSSNSKSNALPSEKDHETTSVVYMLKEVESVTSSTLESLLSYVMGTKVQARLSSLSLVSKLMHSKKAAENTNLNEFNKADNVLQMSLQDDTQVEEFISHLKKMDSSIQLLEEDIECLFRQLIKTRVSLLNILNH